MAFTLKDLQEVRPPNRENVERHKQRMLSEIKAYRLRELREAFGMTQIELAKRAGISQSRVSRIEHGDIDQAQVDTLRRQAKALGGKLVVNIVLDDEVVELV